MCRCLEAHEAFRFQLFRVMVSLSPSFLFSWLKKHNWKILGKSLTTAVVVHCYGVKLTTVLFPQWKVFWISELTISLQHISRMQYLLVKNNPMGIRGKMGHELPTTFSLRGSLHWVNRMAKQEPGIRSFGGSTKRGMNSRWCLEGGHGLEQFVNIHTILKLCPWKTGSISVRTQWLWITCSWKAFTELIRQSSIHLKERCVTLTWHHKALIFHHSGRR